jgi:hypothetical protein
MEYFLVNSGVIGRKKRGREPQAGKQIDPAWKGRVISLLSIFMKTKTFMSYSD